MSFRSLSRSVSARLDGDGRGVRSCSRSAIFSTDNDHLIAGREREGEREREREREGDRLEKVTDKSVNNKRLFQRRRH